MIREKKKELTRKTIMEKGFELFTERGIESVTMQEIADASLVGRATLFNYFNSKVDLVIAIGSWKWKEYIERKAEEAKQFDREKRTGAELLSNYLDAFLEQYRSYRSNLRFNYNFNSYLRSERATPEQMEPFMQVVNKLAVLFHGVYKRGMKDGTLNASISEEEMFSGCFHIMLAAATRYAVGLVYISENIDPEKELVMLKRLLLLEYTEGTKKDTV